MSLDAVILFDSSQSISQHDFATMIQFVKDLIRMFNVPGTQVSVIVCVVIVCVWLGFVDLVCVCQCVVCVFVFWCVVIKGMYVFVLMTRVRI